MVSSLFTLPDSQILLIFPSSSRMCVPHKTPGSLSDTFISVPTITWVVTSSSELAQEFLCSWPIIMRSATHQLPTSTRPFSWPFQTLKQPFRNGMYYSQLKDLEATLERDWVTCPDLKELTSVRPWMWIQVHQLPKPLPLHHAISPGQATLCLIFFSYEVTSSWRVSTSESSLTYLQAVLK